MEGKSKKKKSNKIIFCIITICIVIAYGVISYKNIERGPWKIICITKTNDVSNGFWKTLKEGAMMAAADYEIQIEICGPSKESDIKMQNELIEKAIDRNPDAIILAAADMEKSLPLAVKIKENSIKLFLVDSGVKERIEECTIATDNFKAGIKIGSILKKYVGEGKKLGIISFVKNSKPAIEREKGIREVFNDAKEYIVETQYCNSDEDLAYEQTQSILKKHPDIKALATLNQYSTEGAARAVKDLGLEGKIKVVGMDNSKKEIQYLEEGIVEALVVQKAINMGYLAVEKAVQCLDGENIPQLIDSGCLVITKENMYMGMYQKLLFPFMEE